MDSLTSQSIDAAKKLEDQKYATIHLSGLIKEVQSKLEGIKVDLDQFKEEQKQKQLPQIEVLYQLTEELKQQQDKCLSELKVSQIQEDKLKEAIDVLKRRQQEDLERSTRGNQDLQSRLKAALTKIANWNDTVKLEPDISSLNSFEESKDRDSKFSADKFIGSEPAESHSLSQISVGLPI